MMINELRLATMKRRVRLLLPCVALCVPNLAAFAGINEWTYVGLAPEYISDIEVHPTNPDIIYVSALDMYLDPEREGGLFKTTDRGLTWDTLGFRFTDVWDIAIDPASPETLWIADEMGAYITLNGGETWELQSEGMLIGTPDDFGPRKITICPYDPRYMMCATHSSISTGFYYFSDSAGLELISKTFDS